MKHALALCFIDGRSRFDKRCLAAVTGALSGLALTCVLGMVCTSTFRIHGAVMSFSESLLYSGYANLDLTRIFMASIFIGSSGAMMDLTVDVSAAVYEVVQKRPDLGWIEAVKSGLHVGRAAMGTMTTTLLLAYSGGYIALLMVFMAQGTPIINMLNYKKAIQIIKDGGYATDTSYVSKICSIIERWNLTQYDSGDAPVPAPVKWYRVRKSWSDSKSQKGAYKILENAKKCADENPGYSVFDSDGVCIYTPKAAAPEPAKPDVPFLVKVTINNLNIRKGPGTGYARTQYIPRGVYTIVDTAAGSGASLWGKLKSGAGWISLDYVTRL